MIKTIKFIILISLLTAGSIQAAVDTNLEASSPKEAKLNVFEMKRKLQEQSRQILELTRDMNNIETNLGIQNKRYLKLSDSRMKLEEELSLSKKNIDLDNLNLKKNYNETKNVLMGIVLNKLEKTESPSDILARKILIRDLQNRMVELDSLMKANKEVQTSVAELYSRLESSLATEKELVSVMNELEEKKK